MQRLLLVSLVLAVLTVATGCTVDDDAAPGGAGADPDSALAREVTTCVAPPRPRPAAGVALKRVFPKVRPARPIALVQTSDGPFYLAEQGGRVLAFEPRDDAAPTVAVDLRDRVESGPQEAGLLGLAFHPRYPTVAQVFLSYTARVGGVLTSRVSRFRVLPQERRIDGASEEILLSLAQPFDNHNGGHLAFGRDGLLYVGFGDGGGAGDPNRNGQNRATWLGKVLRIDIDGASGTTRYRVPSDNPFAGGGGRPEIHAWGFRNPWRFSFDRDSGALWLGDVGQDEREEIDVVAKGGNYGWSAREGTRCFRAPCDDPSFLEPVLEYGHDVGRSVTGGFVYRGQALPSLRGVYVFGDFLSGTLWGAFEREGTGKLERRSLIEGSGLSIASFAEDKAGELYVLDYGVEEGALYRLGPAGSAGADPFPQRLSQTGCVDGTDARKMAAGVVGYEVNAPLWSDGADKRRYVSIPNAAQIGVDASGSWELPVGSVLVKEFRVGGRRTETRLLVRHDDGGWAGYTYAWNAGETDALLVSGAQTVETPGGGAWRIPSRGECLQCHTEAAGRVLGFRPAQLNRDVATVGGGAARSQIRALAQLGLFDRDPGDPAKLPALPALEGTASESDRARAYLDANCAHCHRPGGPGRGGLDLRYDTPFAGQRLCDVTPSVGDLGLADARVIAPGHPERSVLLARLERRGLGQMPPLATTHVDEAAVRVVRGWISSLTSCPRGDWRRTVVFLHEQTRPGQDLFFRGGLDFAAAKARGITCTRENGLCSPPIRHRLPGEGAGDLLLDWYGREAGQPTDETGSPATWTTDVWPSAWGAEKRVAEDGYGVEPLNTWGTHEWMLDVDMDCSRTLDGVFELKSYLSGGGVGETWEPGGNHLARCGEVNRFTWGSASWEHRVLEAP